MMAAKSFVFRFSDVEVREREFTVLKAGEIVPVEPKAFRVLLILLRNPQKLIAKEELLNAVWGDAAVTENSLTRSIALLRRLLGDDTRNPRYIETVATVGYRFVCKVEVSEDASGGFETPLDSGRSNSADRASTPRASRTWIWAATAGCCAILVLGGIWMIVHRKGTISPIRSVAVIPLDNLSGDPGQEYFADGTTDELIAMLAKESTLRITSRTSVLQYKGAHRPIQEIARALNVDAIVEGSVSRIHNQVHITLQLIRADSDAHLWAESYDRDAGNVASLPEDAARAIATRLNSSTPTHAAARYINPEAHDDYLRGHYAWVVGRNGDAGKYFEQAVQIQPDYALGWTGLADYYAMAAANNQLDPLQALPKSEAAARKAVELDDSLPRAHAALGAAIFFNRGGDVQVLRELARATELNPQDGEEFHLRAKVLCVLGRYDEAIAVQKQSTAISPFEHPGAMAEVYMCTRQFDAAIRDGEMRLKDLPAAPDILEQLADGYHWKGTDKEAVEMLARQLSAREDLPLSAAVRRAFVTGGYIAVVRCQLAAVEKRAKAGRVSTFELADLHGRLSEHNETLALLEQGANERDPVLLYRIQSDPAFDFLHADARYRSVIQKLGLPPMY